MTASSHSLKERFLSALEVPPQLRADWLERECGDDVGLREQLGQMLEAHDAPQSLFDRTAEEVSGRTLRKFEPTVSDPDCELPGTIIGPYKLLQQIGEGGMGTVYMAEQTQPVRRKVAIKVITLDYSY